MSVADGFLVWCVVRGVFRDVAGGAERLNGRGCSEKK